MLSCISTGFKGTLLNFLNRQLDLAKASLEKDALEERDFSWVTFAFDRKKMKEAKTLVRKFQDEFMELMSENATPDEVYRLSMQLFPLTKKG